MSKNTENIISSNFVEVYSKMFEAGTAHIKRYKMEKELLEASRYALHILESIEEVDIKVIIAKTRLDVAIKEYEKTVQ